MKMYDYLVSYHFSASGYLSYCTGEIQVSRHKKIKTFADIADLNNFIKEKILEQDQHQEVYNVSVYNFILLGRNKH